MIQLKNIFTLFFLSFFIFSCEGEAGSSNNNNNNNDAGIDSDVDSECPVENQCGTNCCTTGEECFLGTCLPTCETERCRGVCCESNEECVNSLECLPICDNTRCGENLTTCCDADKICLDGIDCAVECNANENLCGEDLSICCASGSLCLNNECVIPGDPCGNNYDCPDDSYYCDETINACLPLPTGPICEGESTFTEIDPVLEWYWSGTTYLGNSYTDSMASPIVGDVNGDGIPDIVVVLFANGQYNTDSIIAVLNGAGDGLGGGELLFTIPSADDPTAPKPFGGAAVALANFDDDPGLEIVYNVQGGGVRIADNDGIGHVCDTTTYPTCLGSRFSGASNIHIHGGPSVSDLDHDGMPDVIIGCHALNGRNISDPTLDFVNISGCGRNTVAADLNMDGNPEIVDANHAITIDPNVPGGVSLWNQSAGIASGFTAVADIIPEIPGPEVVNIASQFFLIDGQTGAMLIGEGGTLADTTVLIPGAGQGGAPTVADFDGDGLPEISTAGKAEYVVYDPDCWNPPLRAGGQCASNRTDFILWSTPTQDLSSSMTGSSVFDFQGDGPAEVLYNDECFLHIYDGLDGSELVDPLIPSSSGTLAEYPLVADVDGDGNAEIIIVSNKYAVSYLGCRASWKAANVSIDLLCQLTNCTPGVACTGTCAGDEMCDSSGTCQLPGGTMGVRVYGDANDMWVRTRPIWNQFGYHVTNMEYSNGLWNVPPIEQYSWMSYNNYRQNVQGGALFPVPDLQVTLTSAALCPSEVQLMAVVYNNGSSSAPVGTEVNFYRTDVSPPELIATIPITSTILPGGWERVTVSYENVEIDTDMTFQAIIDEQNIVEECNISNNNSIVGPIRCISIE
jgi:CARDB